ncbi:MAG: alginate export family protein [Thiotrichales bacterium]|nr:alginate export family protein [Thiotrichales bacterium]
MKAQFNMPNKLCVALFAVGILFSSSFVSASEFGSELYDALSNGKVNFDVNLRFENVDQDSIANDANALTLRTRLGYETGKVSGFGAFLEFENTSSLGNEDTFRIPSGPEANGVARPVIADPSLTEVNQAYLSYSGFADTVAKFGRQRINLDNQRFIGAVVWRQNEQTFDGFTVNNKSLVDTSLTYAFLTSQNTILGANNDLSTHVFNASYSGFTAGKWVGYAYLTDFDDSDALDNDTFGISFSGVAPIGGGSKVLYTTEYARQSDASDNPNDLGNDYFFLEGGVTFASGITAKIGYEVLGSDDGTSAFFTPFSTLHKFQGWADVFLNTGSPTGFAGGVEDLVFTVTGKVEKVELLAAYHDFGVDDASLVGFSNYGSEIDLLATTKIGKFNVGAKYASFSSDSAISDVDKFWLWVSTKI